MNHVHGFTREFAAGLARTAGGMMRDAFSLGMERSLKDDGSHLTATDTAINQLVIREVGARFPDFSILAEEGSALLADSEFAVVCDPIDGTTAFAHGIPTCVFSLALVQRGVPVVGVIHDPFLDRLFSAEAGQGAFLNDRPIRVSATSNLSEAVMGLVWWSGEPFRIDRVNELLMNGGTRTVDVGSIAYMGALTAAGELGATIFPGGKPWDTAALTIIVEEAGGRVTDLFGHEQRYDRETRGQIASNGILHDELLATIATAQGG